MNSGFQDLAGCSATARAAAWAKRLESPITKSSKVNFGLRRGSVPSSAAVEGAEAKAEVEGEPGGRETRPGLAADAVKMGPSEGRGSGKDSAVSGSKSSGAASVPTSSTTSCAWPV